MQVDDEVFPTAVGLQSVFSVYQLATVGSDTSFGTAFRFSYEGGPSDQLAVAGFFVPGGQDPETSGQVRIAPFCYVQPLDGDPDLYRPNLEQAWTVMYDGGGFTLTSRVSLTQLAACKQYIPCKSQAPSLPDGLPFQCSFGTSDRIPADATPIVRQAPDWSNSQTPDILSSTLKGSYWSYEMRAGTDSGLRFNKTYFYTPPHAYNEQNYFRPAWDTTGLGPFHHARSLDFTGTEEYDGLDVQAYDMWSCEQGEPGCHGGAVFVCQGSEWGPCGSNPVISQVESPDVTVVSVIDASQFPTETASVLLRMELWSPQGCVDLAIDWTRGIPTRLNNEQDRQYANSYMLRPGDPVPVPQDIDPDEYVGRPDLYRMLNRFQVRRTEYDDGPVIWESVHSDAISGRTHFPCVVPYIKEVGWALKRVGFPSEAHSDNDDSGFSQSGRVFHLAEIRVGLEARIVEYTLAHCTVSYEEGYLPYNRDCDWLLALTGWYMQYIWSGISFDPTTLDWDHDTDFVFSDVFNTHHVFEDGHRERVVNQDDPWTFAIKDASYQFASSAMP